MDFLKKVRFHNTVNVVMIPTAREYEPFRNDLWYSSIDLDKFKKDFIRQLNESNILFNTFTPLNNSSV